MLLHKDNVVQENVRLHVMRIHLALLSLVSVRMAHAELLISMPLLLETAVQQNA
jgi:hypothetical protein